MFTQSDEKLVECYMSCISKFMASMLLEIVKNIFCSPSKVLVEHIRYLQTKMSMVWKDKWVSLKSLPKEIYVEYIQQPINVFD